MRKALHAVALLTALALAGCSGDGHEAAQPVTCPDGTVLTSGQIEAIPGHDDAGFNATSHCPVKPSVTLSGIPATLGAFQTAAFSWKLDNGTVAKAHSMLTSIRYSEVSVSDADLTAVTKYPTELIKREHQDLPVTYHGNLSFSKVGTVYLRAYMEVAGEDYWSDEVSLEVQPVQPTGRVVQFTHPAGEGAQDITPTAGQAALGDAIQLLNEDLRAHTCSFAAGPAATDPLTADMNGGQSAPVVLVVPGLYEFECDGLVAQKTFTVQVRLA